MPSGRIHNIINTAVYGLIAAAGWAGQQQQLIFITPVQALGFTAAYAAGTFLLSPDLDLAENNVDSKRHWGVLGALWVPYGMAFSHRGLSHTWLLGPLTRLVYLALLGALVYGLLLLIWPDLKLPDALPLGLSLFPIVLGYYASQWLHLIADGVRPDHGLQRGSQKFKKLRGRRRKQY